MTSRPHTDLIIAISGMAVRLISSEPSMTERLRVWYADFLDDDAEPVVTLEIEVRDEVQFFPLEPGPWLIRSSVQAGQLHFESYFEAGWVDLRRGLGRLVMARHASVENFLRVLYAHLALERNAVLVHASGVIKDDRGYVFFGPSGSGKTTAARLSNGHTILSDDMVLLKSEHGAVRVYGVPFRGEWPETPRSNVNAELAGLFCLHKDEQHFVAPLERSRALARLVACVPFVMTSSERCQRVMALCEEVVVRVPTAELHFRRDPGFWRVVQAAVAEGSRPG